MTDEQLLEWLYSNIDEAIDFEYKEIEDTSVAHELENQASLQDSYIKTAEIYEQTLLIIKGGGQGCP